MNTNRRTFIKQSGITATALSLNPGLGFLPTIKSSDQDNIDHLLTILASINDQKIEDLLADQIDQPGHHWNGGVVNDHQIPNAHSTCWFIIQLFHSYIVPTSNYYLASQLEQPMQKAAECLQRVQYEDGTIDLHSTNFHSTPDTAFIVNYLSPVYAITQRLNQSGLNSFESALQTFLSDAGKCLVSGGIHTPNHRWVVSAALARLNTFWPDQKFVDRIDTWLSEGIDQDPDGQFTEQSVSIYSPVCDDMFLTMGKLLKRPELLEVVRKNLEMTLYYIQPGGEVLTEASGRQDSAYTGYVNGYYPTYRYFAIKDNNPVYARICNLIETRMPEKITRYISVLMEDQFYAKKMPDPTALPDNYWKRFSHSGVFRIRRGKSDFSVIEHNPTFLTFMKGGAVLQAVRLHAAFFGSRGQFISENTEVKGQQIILTRSQTHGYYQPLPAEKLPGDGDWDKMPRTERRLSERQTLNYRVAFTESNGKATINIEVEGTENVPVSLELSFRKSGALAGVTVDKDLNDVYFLADDYGEYQVENDVIRFGPGKVEHRWAQMRGQLPKMEGNSVYLTGYTPFKHTIELS